MDKVIDERAQLHNHILWSIQVLERYNVLVLDLHINTSTMSIIINTIAPTITEACIHENSEIIVSVTEAVVGDSTLNTNDGTVEETAD